MNDTANVAQHYGEESLLVRLKSALADSGLADKQLSTEDLASFDQFHARGLAATVELGRALQLSPPARVLDIGSGLGGPSRYLAATYGFDVTGLDLNPSFVEAAMYLAERSDISHKVSYQQGNALALPFPDGEFDAAWTQHVAMNIADRDTLYREIYRVLRSGGRFAIFDVTQGADGPLHFPVPWAREPEASFLVSPDRMRELLSKQGFNVVSWIDTTKAAVEWFAERARAQEASQGAPKLDLSLAMGPDFRAMAANLGRNLKEGRASLVQAVLEKP